MFFDVHCHIDIFKQPEMLVRRIEKKQIFTISVSNTPRMFLESRIHLSSSKYIIPALGLHPNVLIDNSYELTMFRKLVDETEFIGEIGLDGNAPKDILAKQEEAFSDILEAIYTKDCICSIHSRNREKQVLKHLKDSGRHSVIFHWYSGPIGLIDEILADGHYFSVNLAMLNSTAAQKRIAAIPLNRILTESDGPFVKFKGSQLSPLDMKETVQWLSRLFNKPFDQTLRTVWRNLADLADINNISIDLFRNSEPDMDAE